jgi:hypothetical protein
MSSKTPENNYKSINGYSTLIYPSSNNIVETKNHVQMQLYFLCRDVMF